MKVLNGQTKIVIVFSTPFQVRQLIKINEERSLFAKSKVFIFLKSNVVDAGYLKAYFRERTDSFVLIDFPNRSLSLPRFLRNPLREILNARRMVKQCQMILEETFNSSADVYRLFIGSEKELLTQMLIDALDKGNRLKELISVDEGTGYYRKILLKDRIISQLYKYLTPLFIKFKYRYFNTLGIHPRINTVYARFPELLPHKKKHVLYFRITYIGKKTSSIDASMNSNKILFFTAPLSEGRKLAANRELEIVSWIKEFCITENMVLFLKQHPRERSDKYQSIKELNYLNKLYSGEDIDYFTYFFIINYGSSIVLDIYERGYPLNRVVTFNNKLINSTLNHIYRETKIVNLDCTKKQLFAVLKQIKDVTSIYQ